MKHYRWYISILILATAMAAANSAYTAISQPAATFSAGGGVTASATYENLGVIGQPGIVGTSAGTNQSADNGFLSVLGDGFKILYPVITATPGTLTFYLKPGSSGSTPLTISNSGGSTLKWTVTKGADPSNIFSINTPTGTDAGTIGITANAASLHLGSFSSSLTVSGAGIDQTVQVLLDLTVTSATYTLAVTLKQAVPGKGGGTVTSTSPDTSLNCNNIGATGDVLCSTDFTVNSVVTLAQLRGSDSQYATWGIAGCGTNPTCQIALTGSQGTTVTFPYSFWAKVGSSGFGSDSLMTAISNAAATDTISTRARTFIEGTAGSTVTLNSPMTISLIGGLDSDYAQTVGFTSLRNVLKIGGGGRLNIKGGGLKVLP